MFGSSTFIFQSVKEGMSVCQCIVYIGGFVGSQRQKLVESQNRFTTDIFLFKNPCMIFEVSTGSYTPADVCQRVRSPMNSSLPRRASSSLTVMISIFCPLRYILCNVA